MSRIPLNVLPTFVAAAQLQNLRLAAASLHLTHSAVSQQIAGLEERLGFRVFDRVGRGIVLNAAGQALLRSVEPALDRIREGVQAATIASCGEGQPLRLTMLPSFAQRWFLPRIASWYAQHPDIPLEIDASNELVDLSREGFHAGLRTGDGPWPGMISERLYDGPTPLIAVGSPDAARRLAGQPPAAVARESLLGDPELWAGWFNAAGVVARAAPVARFNDLSLMLQAAEHGLGLAVAREMFAADALRSGRLVKLFDVSFIHEGASSHKLVYPAALQGWPPLKALRAWLRAELESSLQALKTQRED
jgi:LysR family glycine cleavage system transcriptional activator